LGAPSFDGPQISLHNLAHSDVIAAAATLRARRRASLMRDLMIVTMARCLPHLSPASILAAVSRQTDRGTEQ
jgi:hypothetical protein